MAIPTDSPYKMEQLAWDRLTKEEQTIYGEFERWWDEQEGLRNSQYLRLAVMIHSMSQRLPARFPFPKEDKVKVASPVTDRGKK